MPTQPTSTAPNVYDFAVIGGGVVGAGVLRALTLGGARCALLEKSSDLLDGASKANSAILHTSFDAVPGSIEQKAVARGYEEYLRIYKQFQLPAPQFGALMVANNDAEEEALNAVKLRADQNDIDDIEFLSSDEIQAKEPYFTQSYRAALWIKGEAIIDPWSAPLAYLEMAVMNGADIYRNSEVNGLQYNGEYWSIETASGLYKANHIVNCAGLYGDKIDTMARGTSPFQVKPRKGQFLVFDKAACKFINHILLPVPSEITKGILITPTAFGNVLVGPTAEDQQSRSELWINPQIQSELLHFAISKIPALASVEITAHYCGLRPATEKKDYHLIFDTDLPYTCVGGIRSTGLSSSLGLGLMVAERLLKGTKPIDKPIWPRAHQIAESADRDFKHQGNEGIVCHCERVTKREINAAFDGPIAPNSLAGLKRNTRVTMGRCQGFYCTYALAKMTQDKLKEPLALAQETEENHDQY